MLSVGRGWGDGRTFFGGWLPELFVFLAAHCLATLLSAGERQRHFCYAHGAANQEMLAGFKQRGMEKLEPQRASHFFHAPDGGFLNSEIAAQR